MKQLDMFSVSEKDKVEWLVFIDGASRNNPGPSGAGIYIVKNGVLFIKDGYYLGIKTNNQAEYLAFFLGLCVLEEHYHNGDVVRIISDSQLLVRQINGVYKVKQPHLQPLHMMCKEKMGSMNATISHVLRHENVDADAMANEGIDGKKIPPKKYREQLKNYGVSV